MLIGIIGYGVVGKAIDFTLSKKYKVIKYDKFDDTLSDFSDLLECDIVFISVPTPFDCKKRVVDDSAIIENLERLESLNFNKIVLIKSTVLPGSCKAYSDKFNLKIGFNPEFLRESTTPNEDFENQDIIVIGTDFNDLFLQVKEMYKKITVPNVKFYHTSTTEAEMIKCTQNTMLASRVALANMIFDACQEMKIDYNKLKEIAFDNFEVLGPHMVQVPGPDGKRGFGGKCLPKDIRAFSVIHNSELLDAIIGYNDFLRNDLDKFLMNFN